MRDFSKQPIKDLLKAIKYKCQHDCCCDDKESWVNCSVKTCALWQFRMGENPFKREITEEERKRRSEQMQNINNARKRS